MFTILERRFHHCFLLSTFAESMVKNRQRSNTSNLWERHFNYESVRLLRGCDGEIQVAAGSGSDSVVGSVFVGYKVRRVESRR